MGSKESKERIKAWLSNKYNLTLLGIMVFALVVRLYYFFVSSSQVLWWDECEYMLKAKNIALGTPGTGWGIERPILAPYIIAIFLKIGFGELGIKFLMIFVSLGILALTYYFGRKLFDEKIALLGTFIFSITYLNLFYTARILLNIPELLIGLLMTYFFYISYEEGNKNYLWLVLIFSAFGFLLRFTAAIYGFVMILFILGLRDFKPFKDKKFILALVIFAVIGIIAFFALGFNFSNLQNALYGALLIQHAGESTFTIFTSYLQTIPVTIGYMFLICMLLGIVSYFYRFVLLMDRNFKKPMDSLTKSRLFVLIWIVISLGVYGLVINHFEDRYLMMIFPMLCLLAAQGIMSVYGVAEKYGKNIALVIVVVIVMIGSYQVLGHADSIIKLKTSGYDDLREAGNWLKQNTNPEAVVISTAYPQLTYYGERSTYTIPENESEFTSYIKQHNASFMVLTIYEKSPSWAYVWPEKNKDKVVPVKAYFLDAQQTQPGTIIYAFGNINSSTIKKI